MAELDDKKVRHITETIYIIVFGFVMGIIAVKLEKSGVPIPWILSLK